MMFLTGLCTQVFRAVEAFHLSSCKCAKFFFLAASNGPPDAKCLHERAGRFCKRFTTLLCNKLQFANLFYNLLNKKSVSLRHLSIFRYHFVVCLLRCISQRTKQLTNEPVNGFFIDVFTPFILVMFQAQLSQEFVVLVAKVGAHLNIL